MIQLKEYITEKLHISQYKVNNDKLADEIIYVWAIKYYKDINRHIKDIRNTVLKWIKDNDVKKIDTYAVRFAVEDMEKNNIPKQITIKYDKSDKEIEDAYEILKSSDIKIMLNINDNAWIVGNKELISFNIDGKGARMILKK